MPSKPYVLREMQVPSTRSHCCKSIRIYTSNPEQMTPSADEDMEPQELAVTVCVCVWGGGDAEGAILEDSWVVSYKTNTLSPYDPAIALLSTYPKELGTFVHSPLHTDVILALLTIANTY